MTSDRECMLQQPHIQAWRAARDANGGIPPTHDLPGWRWGWTMVLGTHTFQGTFDLLTNFQYQEGEEWFPALTIRVELKRPIKLYGLALESAEIETVDQHGWRLKLRIRKQMLFLTGHLAAFTLESAI